MLARNKPSSHRHTASISAENGGWHRATGCVFSSSRGIQHPAPASVTRGEIDGYLDRWMACLLVDRPIYSNCCTAGDLGSQMYGSPLRRTGVIGSVVWMQRCDLHEVARAAHAGDGLV